jgi:YggT family protein
VFPYLFWLVRLALEAYGLLIIVRALVSWVNPDPFNPIVRFLYRATEPVLRPIRQRLPDLGGLDISPLVALVAIYVLEQVLAHLLL